jgi:hypothetical protein
MQFTVSGDASHYGASLHYVRRLINLTFGKGAWCCEANVDCDGVPLNFRFVFFRLLTFTSQPMLTTLNE